MLDNTPTSCVFAIVGRLKRPERWLYGLVETFTIYSLVNQISDYAATSERWSPAARAIIERLVSYGYIHSRPGRRVYLGQARRRCLQA